MPDEITHSRPDVFYPKNMPIKIFDDLKKKCKTSTYDPTLSSRWGLYNVSVFSYPYFLCWNHYRYPCLVRARLVPSRQSLFSQFGVRDDWGKNFFVAIFYLGSISAVSRVRSLSAGSFFRKRLVIEPIFHSFTRTERVIIFKQEKKTRKCLFLRSRIFPFLKNIFKIAFILSDREKTQRSFLGIMRTLTKKICRRGGKRAF